MLLTCVTSDGHGPSKFIEKSFELSGDDSRRLTEQLGAVNFRLRSSGAGYHSDFHVAGDPTLLVILAGNIVITLANGESREFHAGDLFIAEDFLAAEVEAVEGVHGHKAEVIGPSELRALHLKLAKR